MEYKLDSCTHEKHFGPFWADRKRPSFTCSHTGGVLFQSEPLFTATVVRPDGVDAVMRAGGRGRRAFVHICTQNTSLKTVKTVKLKDP